MPYNSKPAAPVGGPGPFGQTAVPFTPEDRSQFSWPYKAGAGDFKAPAAPVDEMPRQNSGVYVDGIGMDGVDMTAPAAPQRGMMDSMRDSYEFFSERQPEKANVLSGLKSKSPPIRLPVGLD